MILLVKKITNQGKGRIDEVLNLDHMIAADPWSGPNDWTVVAMDNGTLPMIDLSFDDFISILRINGNRHFYDARSKETHG